MSQIGTLTTTYQCKNCGQPVKVQHGDVFVDKQVADFLVTPCECRLRERLAERCRWKWSEQKRSFLTDCEANIGIDFVMSTQSKCCPECGRKILL
jgi:DNA-directed RNA polymerase subunit RPC12/RpoP